MKRVLVIGMAVGLFLALPTLEASPPGLDDVVVIENDNGLHFELSEVVSLEINSIVDYDFNDVAIINPELVVPEPVLVESIVNVPILIEGTLSQPTNPINCRCGPLRC